LSRWDGFPIYLTKNCSGCRFKEEDNCIWGIATKHLVKHPEGRLAKCQKISKPSPREHH